MRSMNDAQRQATQPLRLIVMVYRVFNSKERFDFEAGGSLEGIDVAYHCSEKPWEEGDNRKVIWICHALTANSDAEDWWPGLVGPGKLFDTEKYFIICGNMLGSCYGSSGPASTNPVTDKPYYFDFPKVTVRDIVKALELLRVHLGIPQIDFLVGSSIGGFQALEWSIMYPDVIKNVVYMATSERVSPWLTAFEESQRLALEADPTFRACESLEGGKAGLKSARSIALLSYRNGDGYNRKQFELSDDTMFADRSASYQRYQGQKLCDRFDAYSYWYLSYSVDSENVGRFRGGVAKALSQIKAKATVIAIDSDLLFTPEAMKAMADNIQGADFHVISSHFGHDGFLLENDQIEKILAPIVSSL